eukprot:COSAG03_NODE_20283_length_321_cov_1.400901_1_plen_80_part_01
MRACACACVRACVCACVRACVQMEYPRLQPPVKIVVLEKHELPLVAKRRIASIRRTLESLYDSAASVPDQWSLRERKRER